MPHTGRVDVFEQPPGSLVAGVIFYKQYLQSIPAYPRRLCLCRGLMANVLSH